MKDTLPAILFQCFTVEYRMSINLVGFRFLWILSVFTSAKSLFYTDIYILDWLLYLPTDTHM